METTDVFCLHKSTSSSSLQSDVNYEVLLRNCNLKLTQWQEFWHQQMQRASGQSFHHAFLNFFRLYVRLFLNSLGVQPYLRKCSGLAPSPTALSACYTSALENLQIITNDFAAMTVLPYGQDSITIMSAYCAVFLLKVRSSLVLFRYRNSCLSLSYCGAGLIKLGCHLTLPKRSTLSFPRLPELTMMLLCYLLPQGPPRIIRGSFEALLPVTGSKRQTATPPQRLGTLRVNRNHNPSNNPSLRTPPPSTSRSSQLYNITPPRPTCGLLRHQRAHPVTIWTRPVMLCPATIRRHKPCSSSSNNNSNNNRLILTLTTGETCSRRSVTNNRWRSCTLMVTSTLRSLSPTSTRLPLAVLLDGEAVNNSFPASLPRDLPHEEAHSHFLTPLIDLIAPRFCLPSFQVTYLVLRLCLVAFRLPNRFAFAFSIFIFFLHPIVLLTLPSCAARDRTLVDPDFSSLNFACSRLLSTHCSLYNSSAHITIAPSNNTSYLYSPDRSALAVCR